MLTIPKQLKIGALTYDVEVVKELGDGAVGKIFFKDKKIKLEEGDPDFMALTLMHEILHAMNAEINEVQIEYMAQGFCQVIKDNPTLFSRGGVHHGKRKKSSSH